MQTMAAFTGKRKDNTLKEIQKVRKKFEEFTLTSVYCRNRDGCHFDLQALQCLVQEY